MSLTIQNLQGLILHNFPSLEEVLNSLFGVINQIQSAILQLGTVVGRDVQEQQRILSSISNFITDAANVIYQPINTIAQSLAGMLVHLTAGLAISGLPAPGSGTIKGARSVAEQKLLDSLYEWLYPTLNPIVQSTALTATQLLANIANEGLSGIFTFLTGK